jgi:Holliday junction DNA helicase RuvA
MIALLNGKVSEKNSSLVIIDVSGVGYGVYVPAEDFDRLVLDQNVKLYIYEYVREQAHDLYGFLSRETMNLFEQLISVNGVGTKMALSMLSIGTVDSLRRAISSGEVKYLQSAPGVGRRLAERVVVDLKDKLGFENGDTFDLSQIIKSDSPTTNDALAALIALGYNSSDAAKALGKVDHKLSTEEQVKQALSAKG